MKILITGGSGFIGRYLRSYLGARHEIIAPSSKELDLLDPKSVIDFFKDKQFDAVIHSAVVGRESVKSSDLDIASKIITMYNNLVSAQSNFGKLINFGSGAEFGLDQSIDNAKEEQIFNRMPVEGYGIGKNTVSRFAFNARNHYTLRVFSCVDPSESEQRLIRKFIASVSKGTAFEIEDRYVDFISLQDLALVTESVLNGVIKDKDINVVYQNKNTVSNLLYKYCEIKNIDPNFVKIIKLSDKNYTGDGSKLSQYSLNLEGLEPTLKRYN